MRKLKIDKISTIFIIVVFILIYAIDGVSKYFLIYLRTNLEILPNKILKGIIILSAIIIYFLNKGKPKTWVSKHIILCMFLATISIFNYFFYDINTSYLLKYSFFIFIVPLFYIESDNSLFTRLTEEIFKYIVIINLILLLVGLIFEIQLFRTYYTRFGYNGLLLTPMQSTYFYISATIVFFKSKKQLMLLISIISSILVGTKILLGFVFLLLIYYIIILPVKLWLKTITIFFLLTISFLLFFLFFQQITFSQIIHNKGWFSAIFSLRNDLFTELVSKIDDLDFNFFTGGVNLHFVRVEMELIDLILFFGFIGLIVYLFIFHRLYKRFVNNNFGRYYFVTIMLFVLLAGNFLYYPINCFYFLLTLKYISLK